MRYLSKRLLLFLPTLLVVTVMVFLLMRVIPGDPALLILAGSSGDGWFKQADLQNLRRAGCGTDRPVYIQYGAWVWGLLRGDLGTSLFYRTPIYEREARAPYSLHTGAGVSRRAGQLFVLAVPLGVLSAVKQNSLLDYATRLFTFTGISIPIFVTGLTVVYTLSPACSGWFPPLGYTFLWEDPWTNLQQMIFPVLALAFFELNFTARVTRSATLEVLREDYIRTTQAEGLREPRVVLLHALRNAFLPIVAVCRDGRWLACSEERSSSSASSWCPAWGRCCWMPSRRGTTPWFKPSSWSTPWSSWWSISGWTSCVRG